MYSYQKFIRDEKLQEKYSELRRSFLEDEDNRLSTSMLTLEKNKTLAQAYKKRLDGFLLSIIEKPIEVDSHHNNPYNPREANTSKHVSKMPFRMNSNTSK